MFLFIIEKRVSNCKVQEKFQYFSNIVSYIFYQILILLLYLYAKIVNLPTKDNVLHPQIIDNIKYFPYFLDCLSVLDSTYIPAHVLAINSAAY